MASTLKQELESRISKIRGLIIDANNAQQKYLEAGENASIYDYLDVKQAVSNFYDTQSVTESHPRRGYIDTSISMYGALQNHSSLACRHAIRNLDKSLLKENGINTKDLLEFKETELDTLIEELNNFYINCKNEMNDYNIDIKIIAENYIAEYISSIQSLPKSQLKDFKLPPVTDFAKEVREKVETYVKKVASEYKQHILKFEEPYKQYKAKDGNATLAEFESIQIALANGKIKGINNSIKEIAINELKEQGCLVAQNIDQYGWLERATEPEMIAYHFVSEYEHETKKLCEKVAGENIRNSVLSSLDELIETMKNQPISSFPNKEILEPKVFISVTLEKLLQEEKAKSAE